MHWLAIYALGIGTAAVAKVAAPTIGRALRPAARTVIKQSLVAGHGLQRLSEETVASLADLTAEAREEIETEERRASVHAVDPESPR